MISQSGLFRHLLIFNTENGPGGPPQTLFCGEILME